MQQDKRLMAFVATCDAARARDFYEGTLALKLLADEPYALVFEAFGTMLRVQKVEAFTPQPFTVLGFEVTDIRAQLLGLRERGVEPVRYPHLPADELGVWSTGGAQVAWFRDPDGNLLSLTQFAD